MSSDPSRPDTVGTRPPCLSPPPDAVSEFTADLWRATSAVTGLMHRTFVAPRLGLTWPQWEILRLVCEFHVVTVGTASQRLRVPKPELIRAAAVLNAHGMACLLPARAGRPAAVAATSYGHDLAPEVQNAIAAVESVLLCPLPEELVWAVTAVLRRVEERASCPTSALPRCAIAMP
jgi:hypothetical protein